MESCACCWLSLRKICKANLTEGSQALPSPWQKAFNVKMPMTKCGRSPHETRQAHKCTNKHWQERMERKTMLRVAEFCKTCHPWVSSDEHPTYQCCSTASVSNSFCAHQTWNTKPRWCLRQISKEAEQRLKEWSHSDPTFPTEPLTLLPMLSLSPFPTHSFSHHLITRHSRYRSCHWMEKGFHVPAVQ